MNPKIIIIAGPNGAGKTTFAKSFLPYEFNCDIFINADMIAAGISPFKPEQVALKAGRIMLEMIQENIKLKNNFVIETTLSGLNYLNHINKWQKIGYEVYIFFIGLPSADMAIDRVAKRVKQGGHNIPEDVIRRRFDAGLFNFQQKYMNIVDYWYWYDNSGEFPKLLRKKGCNNEI